MRNIRLVVDNRLCTGCGGCGEICPQKCIGTLFDKEKGFYVTRVDESKCVDCGLCRKICPVYTWCNSSGNLLVGENRTVYSGYSNDKDLRYDCASGGFTTSLLVHLLEHKYVDAVVTTVRDEKEPLRSKWRICFTKEEVSASRGSVYAPTSYGGIVSELLEASCERVAVVGLPCHIQMLSNLEKEWKKLNGRFFLKISLVCGHAPSLKGYEYSLKHLGIKEEDVKSVRNRGDGWPGFLKIQMRDGREHKIKYGNKYSWGTVLSSPLFTPDGCSHCVDATGYEADISVCDAWLPKFADDRIGRNLVLVRTERAEAIVSEMAAKGIVSLQKEELADFVRANHRVFKEKLIVNGYKNGMALRKGVYAKMRFLKSNSFVGLFFIYLFVYFERMYKSLLGTRVINDGVLFTCKAIKYLSVRWLRISC